MGWLDRFKSQPKDSATQQKKPDRAKAMITFLVSISPTTPDNTSICVAGNFNKWDPQGFPLSRISPDTAGGTLDFAGDKIEYKYTLGSWETVERNSDGTERSNRILMVTPENPDMTVHDCVERWSDPSQSDQMIEVEPRLKNIMECLKNEFDLPYKVWGEKKFEIFTKLSEMDQRSFLDFEITGDVIRVELLHLFGNLISERIGYNELLELLQQNTGQLGTTGAYLSVNIVEHHNYICLNSYHRYKVQWDDRDIADMISLHFFDIMSGLMILKIPEYINVFYKK